MKYTYLILNIILFTQIAQAQDISYKYMSTQTPYDEHIDNRPLTAFFSQDSELLTFGFTYSSNYFGVQSQVLSQKTKDLKGLSLSEILRIDPVIYEIVEDVGLSEDDYVDLFSFSIEDLTEDYKSFSIHVFDHVNQTNAVYAFQAVESDQENSNLDWYQKISEDVILAEDSSEELMDDAVCLGLFNKTCDEIKTTSDKNKRFRDRDFSGLRFDNNNDGEPDWLLPVFGEAPTPAATDEDFSYSSHDLPKIKIKTPRDFKIMAQYSNVFCQDPNECPDYVGLLMGMDNQTAYQATATYWKPGGWFITNAHAIPQALRVAQIGKPSDCSGQIYIKLPENENSKELLLECDQIKFVSQYNSDKTSADLAYFTVKSPEKLQSRNHLELFSDANFSFNLSEDLGSRVFMHAADPWNAHLGRKNKVEGLHGVIVKKTCQVADPYQSLIWLSEGQSLNQNHFYYDQCETNTMGGNSGSIVIDEASMIPVAVHESTGSFNWPLAGNHSVYQKEFKASTLLSCFRPVDASSEKSLHITDRDCPVYPNTEFQNKYMSHVIKMMDEEGQTQISKLISEAVVLNRELYVCNADLADTNQNYNEQLIFNTQLLDANEKLTNDLQQCTLNSELKEIHYDTALIILENTQLMHLEALYDFIRINSNGILDVKIKKAKKASPPQDYESKFHIQLCLAKSSYWTQWQQKKFYSERKFFDGYWGDTYKDEFQVEVPQLNIDHKNFNPEFFYNLVDAARRAKNSNSEGKLTIKFSNFADPYNKQRFNSRPQVDILFGNRTYMGRLPLCHTLN